MEEENKQPNGVYEDFIGTYENAHEDRGAAKGSPF